MSRKTVVTAKKEIDSGEAAPPERVRHEGGGRHRLIDKDPNLLLELDDLVSPEARGDPMSPLRWTAKSTYHLADSLGAKGYDITPKTVGELLGLMDYSLQGTNQPKQATNQVSLSRLRGYDLVFRRPSSPHPFSDEQVARWIRRGPSDEISPRLSP